MADPEDIVQTSFALVLAHAEPIENLRPYVFTVIRREVGHAARRYHTGQAYGSLDADVQFEGMERAAANPYGAADLRLDVEAALQSLPPQQRKAVLLNKVGEHTQAETARVMGKSPGTVATHVSRALAALQVSLQVGLSALAVFWICRMAAWLWDAATGVEFGHVRKALATHPVETAVAIVG
ncbi:RNA polymerase sigma factor [Streptomyces tibetensis]|uniref:RNA polymerase sigma factor n=1 Tax=Streptomyces tibetensis TaxID=2382123 RepID=UPI0037FFCF42